MKKFDCIGFDHPEYWSGYCYPCIIVPVYQKMTNKEVVDGIKEELNMCWDMYEEIMTPENEKLLDEYCAKLMETPDEIGVTPDYEEELGEDDTAWNLYFSWCDPVTVGGLTFLNP